MAPYAIRRRGLQAEIQHVVKRYIIDHHFRPGDPLPGQGELARQLGISRPSLREAMKVLQTIGAIETRHGSGTYVGEFSLDSLVDGLDFHMHLASQHANTPPAEMLDLLDLREAIETHLIRRAAGRHNAQQIASMHDLNEAIARANGHPEECCQLDGELHELFYQPLGSRTKSEFVHVFWKVSTGEPGCAPSGGPVAVADHTAIIEALAESDREAAASAMQRHMRHIVEAVQHPDLAQTTSGRANGIAPVHTLYAD